MLRYKCAVAQPDKKQLLIVVLACLVQMVKAGAVKDIDEGVKLVAKINKMRPHPTHLLLASLKAEQEMILNRPHDVLNTVQPYLSHNKRCCWALQKALWAHWVTGNLPQVRRASCLLTANTPPIMLQ